LRDVDISHCLDSRLTDGGVSHTLTALYCPETFISVSDTHFRNENITKNYSRKSRRRDVASGTRVLIREYCYDIEDMEEPELWGLEWTLFGSVGRFV
jgi:hypothetical protein